MHMSPTCSPLAGRTFRSNVLVVYGNVLSSTQTKGVHREDQHDSTARLFVAQANENGLAADYQPINAFIGVIPRAQRHAFYALRKSTQHSITPDARVQLAPGDGAYYDAKTAHVNGARYPDTNGIDAARGAAVESRAPAVSGEYERHARDVDAACCGVPRGAGDGPVLSGACASSGPCAGSSSAHSARRWRASTRSSRCARALVHTCAGAARWLEGPTCIARSSSCSSAASGACTSRASTRGVSSRACTERARPRPPHSRRPRAFAHGAYARRHRQQLPRAIRQPFRRAHQRPLRRLNVNGVFARPSASIHNTPPPLPL